MNANENSGDNSFFDQLKTYLASLQGKTSQTLRLEELKKLQSFRDTLDSFPFLNSLYREKNSAAMFQTHLH